MKIIKRSKTKSKFDDFQKNRIRKIIVTINDKSFKDKNVLSFSNHDKPNKGTKRKIISTWKFYPSCFISLIGNFGYTSFSLGKKNTIQKKRENEEKIYLKKSKLKYPKYYNFEFNDDNLIISFKYEGVFDDIDSGNGEYNVKQNISIKFERPIDYKRVKECMINYLEKIGKYYQNKS